MYAAERQQAMTQLVRQRGRISVVELAERYDVTTETVRRDLSMLEDRHLIRRVHGGAVPADALTLIEAGLPDRDVSRIEQKQRIAAAAVDLLPRADSTVILDAGSTTVRLSRLLPPNLRMTVITHAVPIAAQLAGSPHIELHVLPGRVRRHTHAAVGTETIEALEQVRADLAFVGTNGITVEHGLSTPDRTEAAVKRAIIERARRTVVLADSSKIGVERTIKFAELSDVDTLVTDKEISASDRRAIEHAGVEVITA
ncbi:DeoR/GlpR transcriptional regulator [Nocardioides islandensis]|uniref:Lactose phosphotransferase system repressor n=1 Tax=Nocardioides islandensis TaxID=433663 RepID=A0A930VLC6_9ACTN|nr:DeoR/GlpR family DNA-binding transcription regulator [Nocardioides islandensis]MBF4766000.1 DeoR/GlpR transcriptional regulator [Nocardioides islandensis]